MPIEGGMGEEKLWDYDLHVNDNEVPSPLVFNSGESSRSQLVGSSSGFEGQTDYDFSSFLDEFEKEYQQNPENHLAPNPSMVNDHISSSEENPITKGNSAMAYFPILEEIPPEVPLAHDLVSPFQETGMMDYIPTFVEDMKAAESAPFSSLVHQIGSLPEEEFQEIVMTSNMVDDHVVLSNEGNVAMEETVKTPRIQSPNEGNVTMMPNPVILGENVVQHEQAGQLDKIPCPTVTFFSRAKPQVVWTRALHERFVRAVKHLGGRRSAKPMDILSLMNVEGLNRVHVASHLQKYRKGPFRRGLLGSIDKFTYGYQ